MEPKTNPPITQVFVAVLVLIIVFLIPFRAVASPIALPGCPDNCGDTPIPYPFGIGPGCSLKGFELSCTDTLIFLSTDVQVLNISLDHGQARVINSISSRCYDDETGRMTSNPVNMVLRDTPYRLNTRKNKFTVIGCNNLAYISFDDGTNLYLGGFVKNCNATEIVLINGSCPDVGCWQTAIPTAERDNYLVDFDANYSHSEDMENQCGYVMLMEDAEFLFSSENITADVLYQQQIPLILDWAIRNEMCDVAQANRSTYGCRSNHSVCVDSTNGPGYLCSCSDGYKGNPYLEGGCQGFPFSLTFKRGAVRPSLFSYIFYEQLRREGCIKLKLKRLIKYKQFSETISQVSRNIYSKKNKRTTRSSLTSSLYQAHEPIT
jgi:Wall-associated receptor kinase galacturonan-binding